MNIDTNSIVTATEASRNFSREDRMADNRPGLPVINPDTEPQTGMSEDEKLEFVARRILREHRAAFEKLAE